MKTHSPVTEKIGTLLFYLFLSGIFFYPLFQGKVLFFKDNLLHIAPAAFFWRRTILAGKLPLWNPEIFAGVPFLADPTHAVFSPLNLMFFLFKDILTAITFEVIILIWLTSLGAYFLARTLRLGILPSVFVGLVFGFSGSVFEAANDLNSLVGIAFIPWALGIFIFEVYRKGNYFSWKLALVLALQLISGHTQYGYYTLLLLGLSYVYILLKKRSGFKNLFVKRIGLSLGTLALVLGLAAVQILPAGELVTRSRRAEAIADFSGERLQMVALPRLVFPKIYGSLVEGNSWGPGSLQERGLADVRGTMSLAALLLAGWGVIKFWRQKRVKILIMLGLLSLLVALEKQTPLFAFLQHSLPGFASFRSPQRILVIYSLAVALLAGISLQNVLRHKRPEISFRTIGIVMVLGLSLSLYIAAWQPALFGSWLAKVYEITRGTSLYASSAYNQEKVQAISRLIAQSLVLFFLGLGGFLTLIYFATKKIRGFFYLGTVLVMVELFLIMGGNLLFVDYPKIQADKAVVDFLTTHLGQGRYISTADTEAYTGIWVYFNHLATRPPFSQESVTEEELQSWRGLRQELAMLPTDTNQFYGLKSAAGYVALLPEVYRDAVGSPRVNSLDFKSFNNPILDELGVKYVVTGIPKDMVAETKDKERFRKVFQSGRIVIYENTQAKPRIEFLGEKPIPASSLEIKEDNPNQVSVNLHVQQPGELVLRDLWYPGWQVQVDGIAQSIKEYQGLFRAVSLPAGDHQVIFRYFPISFILGNLITGFSFIFTVMMVVRQRLKLR